jgi:hypothetical protein
VRFDRSLVFGVAWALFAGCSLPDNLRDAHVPSDDVGDPDVDEDAIAATDASPGEDVVMNDTLVDAPSPIDVPLVQVDAGCPATLRPPSLIAPAQGAVLAAAEAVLTVSTVGATAVEFRYGSSLNAAQMMAATTVPVLNNQALLTIPYAAANRNRPCVWIAVARCGGRQSTEVRSSFRFGTREPAGWRPNTFSRIEFDANGDGRTDLLAGGSSSGRPAMLLTLGGGVGQQSFLADGLESGSNRMFALGDVTGDGFGDIMIQRSNRLSIYAGGSGGLSRDPWAEVSSVTFGSMTSTSSIGRAVAPLGDFDGDGRGDFAIADFERVFIVPGAAVRSSATTLTASAVINFSTLGGVTTLAAADFNGDGFVDLAAGTPSAASASGRVWIYRSTGGMFSTTVPSREIIVNDRFLFGSTMTTGIFRNDGTVDLLIGSQVRLSPMHVGSALVYRMPLDSAAPQSAMPTSTMITIASGYGAAVATSGDVDGNGADEFAVLARTHPGPSGDGVAFVFELQSDDRPATELFQLAPTSGQQYGDQMIGIGTWSSTTPPLGFAFTHPTATVGGMMPVGNVYVRTYSGVSGGLGATNLNAATATYRNLGWAIIGG